MTPEQAKAERRSLVPQLEAYDRLAKDRRRVPFLMFSHQTGFRSDCVNTDRHGFRWSILPGGKIASIENPPAERCGVLVGGSTAFGVGAATDASTVASVLSAQTGIPWVNLGVRAHSSTQELLTFLFYSDVLPPVSHIVVMTGVNDLLVQYGANWFDDQLGGSMYADPYLEGTARPPGGLARLGTVVSNAFRRRAAPVRYQDLLDRRESDRRAAIERILVRNVAHWASLASGRGAHMLFTLQPTSPWMGKTLSREERLLFDAREAQDPRRDLMIERVLDPANRAWYGGAARGACEAHGIGFSDLNESLGRFASDDEWLFVDRAHFTDRGYAAIAQCIESLLE